jgi:hypothetical protein
MRGLPFVRNGITLLSEHDPVRLSNRIADTVNVRDKTLFFCPSPLFGYGLDRLLSRIETEAPNSAILCIEADPQLYQLAVKSIGGSLTSNRKLHITNICEAAGLCSFIRETWGERAFRRIETVKFTGGWQLYPELYNSLIFTIHREIAVGWSNALTLAKLGRLYIRNAVQNLSLMQSFPTVNELSFGESPVLVLGAGPSLDEILDSLDIHLHDNFRNREKRNFKIICVDTCAAALKDRNIIPDLVVILESQHWNLRDFIGCGNFNVSAAVDISALPQSAKIFDSQSFVFFTPWTSLRIFERLKKSDLLPAIIPPLGSVGLSAVEIARRVSCGKIICAGLDFSFSVDKHHARSTSGHYAKINTHNRFKSVLNPSALDDIYFTVVSKSGRTVRSSHNMRNYRNLFEQEFGGDRRLFDIVGSGLPLGVNTLDMDEVIKILDTYAGSPAVHPCELKKNKTGEKLKSFIKAEKDRLEKLKNILTGETADGEAGVNILLDECNYLWAHFPDCSGGCRPSTAEIAHGSKEALSFLKRIRAEIDPMVKLFERVVEDIT